MSGELETAANWPPYKTKNWMERKAREGYYQQMLMKSGAFVASIAPIMMNPKKSTIGVDDFLVRKYMISHEIGMSPQPQRSVFAKALELYGDEWIKLIKEEIENLYLNTLKFKIKKIRPSGFPSGSFTKYIKMEELEERTRKRLSEEFKRIFKK